MKAFFSLTKASPELFSYQHHLLQAGFLWWANLNPCLVHACSGLSYDHSLQLCLQCFLSRQLFHFPPVPSDPHHVRVQVLGRASHSNQSWQAPEEEGAKEISRSAELFGHSVVHLHCCSSCGCSGSPTAAHRNMDVKIDPRASLMGAGAGCIFPFFSLVFYVSKVKLHWCLTLLLRKTCLWCLCLPDRNKVSFVTAGEPPPSLSSVS